MATEKTSEMAKLLKETLIKSSSQRNISLESTLFSFLSLSSIVQ